MSVNTLRRVTVRKKSDAELAAEKKAAKAANKRSVGAVMAAQIPGLAGFALIAMGLFVMACCERSLGSYLATRGGALMIAAGVASLGYWGFANRDDRYNF